MPPFRAALVPALPLLAALAGPALAGERATGTRPAGKALAGYRAWAAGAMARSAVPGMAVGVIQDGKVVLLEGFGQRDPARGLPVTPATLFPISSITKSFACATAVALAREGKLDLDAPVRDQLPGFRLWSEELTARVTPRDLLTHRTGLPGHDLVWYGEPLARRELVERLRWLEPSADLRARFQYNNLGVLAAGVLVERAAGRSWEEEVRSRLLGPLGMEATGFSVAHLRSRPDHALPHVKDEAGRAREIPFLDAPVMAPAHGMVSSAEELVRWAGALLGKGSWQGKAVLEPADVSELQQVQMATGRGVAHPELPPLQYGLGLFVGSYRGHRLVQHVGWLDGFSLALAFLPDDGLGAVALTNLGSTSFPYAAIYAAFDRLLGLDPVDWTGRYLEEERKEEASEEEARKKGLAAGRPGTRPSRPLEELAGEYRHPGYGPVHVAVRDGALTLELGRHASTLRHVHYDVWEVPPNRLDKLERLRVMFQGGWDGEVAALAMPLEDGIADVVFRRAGDPSMRTRAFLEPLAGTYDAGGTPMVVELRGGETLYLLLPGQPASELVPVRGTRFEARGMAATSVEFRRDAQGRAVEALVRGAFGTWLAPRRAEGAKAR
jgi:CubicO group peptidase (beta-lactamase class C family)